MANARSLPKEKLEKMVEGLDDLLKGRFMETIRCDRKTYIKTAEELNRFVEENYREEKIQREMNTYLKENTNTKTFYQIRDAANKLSSGEEK